MGESRVDGSRRDGQGNLSGRDSGAQIPHPCRNRNESASGSTYLKQEKVELCNNSQASKTRIDSRLNAVVKKS